MRKNIEVFFSSEELEEIRQYFINKMLKFHRMRLAEDACRSAEDTDDLYDNHWLKSTKNWKIATLPQIAISEINAYNCALIPRKAEDSLNIVIDNETYCYEDIERIWLQRG